MSANLSETKSSRAHRVVHPALVAGALVLVLAALIFRLSRQPQKLPPLDPLRGNNETAMSALVSKLDTVPSQQLLPLLLTYVQDSSAGLRYAAVDQLGKWKTPEAIAAVKKAFLDCDSEVRRRALYELPKMDFTAGQMLLVAALHDEDPWVREDAATQFSLIAARKQQKLDPSVVPALVRASQDPDINVAQMAMSALSHMLHKPWYVSMLASPLLRKQMADQWMHWWQGVAAKWPVKPAYISIKPLSPTLTLPAPSYSLQMLDGRTLTPESQKGRITLINFWGLDCGPCMAEMPQFNELAQRYRGQPVDIVGAVAGNDAPGEIRTYCRAKSITFPQGIATPLLMRQFGDIEDVPVTVLIDPQERICRIWQGGPRDPEPYSHAIDRLLEEGK